MLVSKLTPAPVRRASVKVAELKVWPTGGLSAEGVRREPLAVGGDGRAVNEKARRLADGDQVLIEVDDGKRVVDHAGGQDGREQYDAHPPQESIHACAT